MDYVVCYLLLAWFAHTDIEAPAWANAFLEDHAEVAQQAGEALAGEMEWADGEYIYPGKAALDNLRNWRSLVGDAPRLEVLHRLPGRDSLYNSCQAARAHVEYVEGIWAMYPHRRDEIEPWLSDARALYRLYDELYYAACDGAGVAYRRAALGRAAEMIGRDRLEFGALPGPLPVWRFRRID